MDQSTEFPIRVLICDDQMIVRCGLETLLENANGVELVGKAGSAEEAIAMCAKVSPQVILMDLIMAGMGGIAGIKQISRLYPDVAVIALTGYDSSDLVEGALNAGAAGYLMKYVNGQELLRAIRSVHRRSPVLSPEAAQHLLRVNSRTQPIDYGLTRREREVLALMVDGLSTFGVSERLMISPYTVKNHVSSILGKLNVATRTEAVILAIKQKIVLSQVSEDSAQDAAQRITAARFSESWMSK